MQPFHMKYLRNRHAIRRKQEDCYIIKCPIACLMADHVVETKRYWDTVSAKTSVLFSGNLCLFWQDYGAHTDVPKIIIDLALGLQTVRQTNKRYLFRNLYLKTKPSKYGSDLFTHKSRHG